ncbi:MAG: hypothetical protein M3O06_03225 [Pseudomonadota bacterium]|nr:hypothetical protein [Pseudomonadota bacterium]
MREWLAHSSVAIYFFLIPFAWFGLAGVVLILLPLSFWTPTRTAAGLGMFFASVLFGAATLCLSAAITYSTFGWLGLLIGIFLLGFGVIPLGIYAAFFRMDVPGLGLALLVMLAITFIASFCGVYFVAKET